MSFPSNFPNLRASVLWDDTDPPSVMGMPFPGTCEFWNVFSPLGAYQAPLAVIDGDVIPYDLYTSLADSKLHHDVPIVFGTIVLFFQENFNF